MSNHLSKILGCAIAIAFMTQGPQTASAQKSRAQKLSQYSSALLVATEHGVPADGKTDAADAIQRLIDNNPNRTIFFPDGTYLVSRPILTPSDPKKSVDLVLANYAVMKATTPWPGGAVVRLGALSSKFVINENGSNYGLHGGIIDGSGVADGVSIDGGRETRIDNVSIKHTHIGLHVKKAPQYSSSDADICDVNIVGNDSANSIGLLIEGFDNSFSNMRIASVNVGVWSKSGGNSMRNIHPLYIFSPTQDYESSCGFVIEEDNNWMNYCYSDQFATGFLLKNNASSSFTDCYCYWYSGKVPFQTAIRCEKRFETVTNSFRADFHNDCAKATLLQVGEPGGKGTMQSQRQPAHALTADDVSKEYIK